MDQNELKKLMNEEAGVISQTSAATPKSTAATADANTDVGTLIRQAMAAGASASEVQSLVDRRTQKALGTANLNQYAYDDLAKQANEYIKTQGNTDYIKQMFEQQKQTDIAAIRSAIQSGIASIQNGVQSALPQYDAMNKQSEAQRYASQRALAEAMANRGDSTTAGLSGMGRGDVLSVENAASERLGSIALQKQQMQDEAARSIADLERSGSLQEAQAASSADQAKLAALLQEQSDAWNRNMQQTQFDYQREQDAYSRQTTEQQTEYDRLQQQAETRAAFGDFSGYRALGYSDAAIAQMTSRYQAELLASQQKTSGASSGTSTGTTSSQSGANLYEDMKASGDPYTYLMTNYKKYGVAYTGLNGVWEQYQKQGGADDAVKRLAQMAWSAAGSSGAVNDPNAGKRLQAYMQERIMSGTVTKEAAAAALKILGFDAE